MNFINTILVGFKEVWAHKFRSLLTMLGIILGVASLVAMAAIIKGMENGMKEAMIAMGGADKVLVQDQDVPAAQDQLANEAPGRTMVDVKSLEDSAPMIRLISPEMAVNGVTITRGSKAVRPSECVGVWPAALPMNLHTLQYGRFFNAFDEERASAVCVIGTGIRDDLFGSPDEVGHTIVPIGKIIDINGQPFTIVGMFEHYESEREKREEALARERGPQKQKGPKRRKGWGHKGGWAFWRKNYTVYMPLNTAWIRFRASSGQNNEPDPKLTDIDLKVAGMSKINQALQQAQNVLMLTHHGIEDFNFRTQEDRLDNIKTQIRNAQISGGSIAGISLLVGGIGIMNIMLASINERIREIGICKAVGATGLALFTQILVESVVVSLVGAAFGVLASYGLVHVIEMITPTANLPVVTPLALVIAVAFSILVGIFAGIFPAIKAARLNPIEALRYE